MNLKEFINFYDEQNKTQTDILEVNGRSKERLSLIIYDER